VASRRGLAVQLREKRKKFKVRAGCAVEGAEKKIQGKGAATLEKKMGLGLGIFCIFF
jgi:hypothetical protein